MTSEEGRKFGASGLALVRDMTEIDEKTGALEVCQRHLTEKVSHIEEVKKELVEVKDKVADIQGQMEVVTKAARSLQVEERKGHNRGRVDSLYDRIDSILSQAKENVKALILSEGTLHCMKQPKEPFL